MLDSMSRQQGLANTGATTD
jgi:rhamnogalacturonyl hydrolase YesR